MTPADGERARGNVRVTHCIHEPGLFEMIVGLFADYSRLFVRLFEIIYVLFAACLRLFVALFEII